jgi:hypothetical protein
MLPPNLGKEPPYPLKGYMEVMGLFVIPCFWSYKKLLNYFEYKRL